MKRVTLVFVMGALLLVLVAGVAVARTFECKETPCVGTKKDDEIRERQGDGVRDDISGLKGDDFILAFRFGNDSDLLKGGPGNDVLAADDGDGLDTVNCGSGRSDTAFVDRNDAVSPNCEGVRMPGDGA